jgi:hypothetical protein
MESLNSPGGHILVSLLLIFVGLGAAHANIQHGSELVVFSLGVLSRSMMDGAHHGTQTKIETKTEGDAK